MPHPLPRRAHAPAPSTALALALALTLALSAAARADEGAPPPTPVAAPAPAAPAAPERTPLMAGLHAAGLAAPLEAVGIRLFGYVEGSYTANFDDPDSRTSFGRVFDFEHDHPLFNQLNFTIERTLDPARFDVGGRLEWIYGADAGFLHSSGLFTWYDGLRHPETQWDPLQAYLDVNLPVGRGLTLRAGKFVALQGHETIPPVTNALYSHSYLFGFAIPFTHTGATLKYSVCDPFTVTAGIVRGWEQTLRDNNDAPTGILHFAYAAGPWSAYLCGCLGPEQLDNEDSLRGVGDLIVSFAAGDGLTLAVNADYGAEEEVGEVAVAEWYGTALTATWAADPHAALTARLEWFRDADGTRLGVSGDFYEMTCGVGVTPFPDDPIAKNLLFRPELRVDWSNESVFNDGAETDQLTFAADLIFKF
ncbi:MAG: porin [Planctomycetes bacterium]|nr:porin [Planctomycetota bacterium]